MAQSFVPTSDTPFYSQRTTLEGREFLLQFIYNQRENVYYLTIRQTDNTVIKAGIKVVTNWPLLRRYKYDARLPPGELYAFSFHDDAPAGFGEIGETKRVRLTYFDSEEQESIGGQVGAT